jgi:hypothetical protein
MKKHEVTDIFNRKYIVLRSYVRLCCNVIMGKR